MNRYIDSASEGVPKQGNSRLNMYGTKSVDVSYKVNLEVEHDGSQFEENSSIIEGGNRVSQSLKSKNQKDC